MRVVNLCPWAYRQQWQVDNMYDLIWFAVALLDLSKQVLLVSATVAVAGIFPVSIL